MIYEWKCINETCDNEIEKMMKLAQYEKKKDTYTCPKCKHPMAPKVTVPHFRLVGGNWERDNYSNQIQNDQKTALDIHDQHTEDHERLMEKERRLGL